MLVPFACNQSFYFALLLRVLIGLFESASFPCVYHFYPIWIPEDEKTFLIPLISAGMYMGDVIGFSLSGVLVDSVIYINGQFFGGWPSVFYVFGIIGCFWFPFWAYFAYESPNTHPYISNEETLMINKGKGYMPIQNLLSFDQNNYNLNQPILTKANNSNNNSSTDTNSILVSHYTSLNSNLSGLSYDEDDNNNQPKQLFSDESSNNIYNILNNPHYNNNDSNYNGASTDTSISIILDDVKASKSLANRTPWIAFLTNPTSLTLLAASWCHGWTGYTLVSEMPAYLNDELGYDLQTAGFICIFPFLALFLSSIVYGMLFNHCQARYGWSKQTVRLIAQINAFGCSSSFLLASGFAEVYPILSVILLIISQ
eukprot:gene17429-24098_t